MSNRLAWDAVRAARSNYRKVRRLYLDMFLHYGRAARVALPSVLRMRGRYYAALSDLSGAQTRGGWIWLCVECDPSDSRSPPRTRTCTRCGLVDVLCAPRQRSNPGV